MKKAVIAFMLLIVMAMSFAVPAMANTVEVKDASYQEIVPLTERTVIYHRWSGGRLQFRVWGAVSMRWLTEWQYV
jgi:hypothetical protein